MRKIMTALSLIWPIALIVLCNTIYQVCSKSVPGGIHPMAALTITYAIATITCVALYFLMNHNGNLLAEYKSLNWAPYVLGVVIVGLEAGFIYAYKAGWYVSSASVVQSSILAVALIFVGYFLYNEALTWNKIVGALICIVGIIFINYK